MRFKSGMAVLAIITMAIAAGTAHAQKTIEEIITRVNGDIILKSEYDARVAQIRADMAKQPNLQGAQLEQAIADETRHLLRNLIDERLIVQVARDMGLSADLEVIRALERMRQENNLPSMEALEQAMTQQGYNVDDVKSRFRNEMLTTQVLQREVYHKVIVTTEDIRAYYEANKAQFDKPQGVRLREIVILTDKKTPEEIEAQKKKAEDALAAVKRGDDFGEVAQKYSEADTASAGGDLGFFEKGQLSNPLEDVVWKLETGQTSEILTMRDGFAIIKLEDKHAGGVLPFELAQDEIQNRLWSQRVQPKIREYLTKLRAEGFVEVREGYVDTGAAPKAAAADAKSVKN